MGQFPTRPVPVLTHRLIVGALGHSEYVFKWFIQVPAEAICSGKQELMREFEGWGPNSHPGWDGASLMEA